MNKTVDLATFAAKMKKELMYLEETVGVETEDIRKATSQPTKVNEVTRVTVTN